MRTFVTKKYPNSDAAWDEKIFALKSLGKIKEALDTANQAIKTSPYEEVKMLAKKLISSL